MMRRAMWSAAMLAAVAMVGCKDSAGPEEPPSYRLKVTGEGTALRSVLIGIEGITGEPTILVGGTMKSIVLPSGSGYRVLLIGSIDATDLLEVKAASASVTPTATVLDASAGASAGYRRMGVGEVSVEWAEQ